MISKEFLLGKTKKAKTQTETQTQTTWSWFGNFIDVFKLSTWSSKCFILCFCLSYFIRCPLLPGVVLSHICKRAVTMGTLGCLRWVSMTMMMTFYYAHFRFLCFGSGMFCTHI